MPKKFFILLLTKFSNNKCILLIHQNLLTVCNVEAWFVILDKQKHETKNYNKILISSLLKTFIRCHVIIALELNFACRMLEMSVHWKKKWSHFDLKSWVTAGTKLRPEIPKIGIYFSQFIHIFFNYSKPRVEF